MNERNGDSQSYTETILDSEVNVLICAGLEEKTKSILRENGVEIFSGASGKVRDVIKEWKVGFLPIADDSAGESRFK